MASSACTLHTPVMANPFFRANFALAVFASLLALTTVAMSEDIVRKPYIVHMKKSMKPLQFSLHEHWYASLINEVTSGTDDDGSLLLYTYDVLLHGFAAKLSSGEAETMETMEACLAAIPSSVDKIHTTRSPHFLGLSGSHNNLWLRSHYGKDVIVGVLDTGIWPESESFHDGGLGAIPPRWKGTCESGVMFDSSHCNNKIIGARYFFKGYEAKYGSVGKYDYKSARDSQGHGTHTASTVAGSPVAGASFSGFANGTATGMAPNARLAIYKVLWGAGGAGDGTDIAAAMEQAVADGVDIISLSLGAAIDRPFYQDSKAIVAFKAMEKGVFVSASAGNEGPFAFSVSNTAPWITTVGASTVDREFPGPVVLGNMETYRGTSNFYTGEIAGNGRFPLVYLSQNENTKYCEAGTLQSNTVTGKIVLCDIKERDALLSGSSSRYKTVRVVKEAGAAGVILANNKFSGEEDTLVPTYLPATIVSYAAGLNIKAYINSTRKPTAIIKSGGFTIVGNSIIAPIVAAFSSRGPSRAIPEILKPDVIAPGVNILAASPGEGYAIMSGTSMSCPHVSGIAALIRSVHPSWSPAAVKSALMTSAYVRDNRNLLIKDRVFLKAADPFALGAGHVNPGGVVDPGLIYDITPRDYIHFLCTLNYTAQQIGLLMDKEALISCPNSEGAGDLNYPSFSVIFNPTKLVEVKMRTVTNVGGVPAAYRVWIQSPGNVKVSVEPNILKFTKQDEKLKYSVRFESKSSGGDAEFGEISWRRVQ
ncbi:hypothetical protein KI387_018618, partial [Taxus chinensis]